MIGSDSTLTLLLVAGVARALAISDHTYNAFMTLNDARTQVYVDIGSHLPLMHHNPHLPLMHHPHLPLMHHNPHLPLMHHGPQLPLPPPPLPGYLVKIKRDLSRSGCSYPVPIRHARSAPQEKPRGRPPYMKKRMTVSDLSLCHFKICNMGRKRTTRYFHHMIDTTSHEN